MNQSGFRDTVLRQSYVFNTGTNQFIQAVTAMLIDPSFQQPSSMILLRMEMISESTNLSKKIAHTEST
jgi:hypothetical protein